MKPPATGPRLDAPLSIAIVGGGIGGLTAALALSAAGHDTTIIERRTGFSEVGAGLQLSPNASRVLIALGLGPALRKLANEPPGVTIRELADASPIGGVALGSLMRERHGAPYYVVHRADLQTILLDAVRSRPSIRLLVGRDMVGLRETEQAVVLSLKGTDSGRKESLQADLVVAADGVRSNLRARFDDRPLSTYGQAAWRATIALDAAPPGFQGAETGLWLGPRRHVVHYPIGRDRLNIVAIAPERHGDDDWGRLGDPSVLAAHFRNAAEPLQSLLAVPDTWMVWSLVDRRGVDPMARGRVALLGDAAHPILPFLAQGAAMAIEDAAVLAACIAAHTNVASAMAAYSSARTKRVRRVQKSARANGSAYHAGRLKGLVRNLVIKRRGPAGMSGSYDWLYGWAPP